MGRRRDAGLVGPDGTTRLVVATADPAMPPARAIWSLATNLPRPGGARVHRTGADERSGAAAPRRGRRGGFRVEYRDRESGPYPSADRPGRPGPGCVVGVGVVPAGADRARSPPAPEFSWRAGAGESVRTTVDPKVDRLETSSPRTPVGPGRRRRPLKGRGGGRSVVSDLPVTRAAVPAVGGGVLALRAVVRARGAVPVGRWRRSPRPSPPVFPGLSRRRASCRGWPWGSRGRCGRPASRSGRTGRP